MFSTLTSFERDPFFNFDRSFSSTFDDMERQFDLSRQFSDRLALEDRPGRDDKNGKDLARRYEGSSNRNALQRHRDGGNDERNSMLAPFSGMGLFGNMEKMMQDMHRNMEEMMQRASQDPNACVYQSSNFYSYDGRPDSNGKGEPRIYQAHHSLHKVGDLKEEHKGVRDTRLGEERMHVGRYIADRGEIQERRHNLRTGDREMNRELVGLETDEDAARFEETWREKSRQLRPGEGLRKTLPEVDYHTKRSSSHHMGEREDRHRKDARALSYKKH